jgi:hypothetical protein
VAKQRLPEEETAEAKRLAAEAAEAAADAKRQE